MNMVLPCVTIAGVTIVGVTIAGVTIVGVTIEGGVTFEGCLKWTFGLLCICMAIVCCVCFCCVINDSHACFKFVLCSYINRNI